MVEVAVVIVGIHPLPFGNGAGTDGHAARRPRHGVSAGRHSRRLKLPLGPLRVEALAALPQYMGI